MLDPQARALIDLMVANGEPPVHTLSPADARDEARSAVALCGAVLREVLAA